jgi:hypothetical protein
MELETRYLISSEISELNTKVERLETLILEVINSRDHKNRL